MTKIEIEAPISPEHFKFTKSDIIDVVSQFTGFDYTDSVDVANEILYGYGRLVYLKIEPSKVKEAIKAFRKLGLNVEIVEI